MSDTVISVKNLGKCYRIKHEQQGGMRYKALRDVLTDGTKSAGRRLWSLVRGVSHAQSSASRFSSSEDFWALKDVSFEVPQGDVLGIIGRNGAGKSTLLKILSRITQPTKGHVRIKGRVASLLEVGTGFHPELTGRENIFLNGAILGMHRTEISKKFDEIVQFAEVENFLDTPVKRYSSGMYVRLAFAVAAHLEPEILIVDEVLAVGDAAFQKKCLGKMGDVARGGRTVIFVSHSVGAIKNLCQKAMHFESGRIVGQGDVTSVIDGYLDGLSKGLRDYKTKSSELIIQKVVLKNGHGQEARDFCPGEDLIVEVSFNARQRLEKPYVIVIVHGFRGNCFTANMLLDGYRPLVLEGKGRMECRFKGIPLLPQRYTVRMSILANHSLAAILDEQEVASFSVDGKLEEYGYRGEFLSRVAVSTSVVVPYQWLLPDGSVAAVSLERDLPRGAKPCYGRA